MYNVYVNKFKGVIQSMKNIKHFKYKNTYSFNCFLCECGYSVDDVNGYSVGWKEQYNGNLLRVYIIYFNIGKYKLFRVLFLKDFNEYEQIISCSKINKLLMWYDSANIVRYKRNDKYAIATK